MAKYKISQEKLDSVKAELKAAIEARPAIVEKVSTARDLGDLKENSEYHAARDEQRSNELKIEELEAILADYEIVEGSSSSVVEVGSVVKLRPSDGQSGQVKGTDTKTFTIVSSVESDPLNGKISDESPIGQVLIGKTVGDEIEIAGKKYKIGELG